MSRTYLAVVAVAAVLVAGIAVAQSSSAGPAMCFGMPATITAVPGQTTFGTAGDDVIIGTPGPDTIRGLGGADKICSRGGNDNVEGGGGADMIDTGGGNDLAEGGKGNDTIRGGKGNDRLEGNGGRDTVNGGRGKDQLFGGAKVDTLRGQGGNDTIRGGRGIDVCAGGPGHSDRLFSCNDLDRFVGKRSGIDVDGTFHTIMVTSTGPGTYHVVLTDTGWGSCGKDSDGNPLHGAIVSGPATSQGNTLVWDYTRVCQGGGVPDNSVVGAKFNLMPDDSLVNDIDGAVLA
ncbi:MAG: calcium-binding protein [Acidimicrobiales bacterium]